MKKREEESDVDTDTDDDSEYGYDETDEDEQATCGMFSQLSDEIKQHNLCNFLICTFLC